MPAIPGQIALELPPVPGNPRNSEGAFIPLKDGRILLAYTRYYGDRGGDHDPAVIAARYSADGGRTWSTTDQTLIPNEGDLNVMSVSLLRLADGRIALLHLLKNANFDCRPRLRFSEDEAKTWSDPIAFIPEKGYYVGNNDRLVQLRSGRLIMPFSRHDHHQEGDPPKNRLMPGRMLCYLSDDAGQIWRRTRDIYEMPTIKKSGLQEPGVIELNDGRLFCWTRTDGGCQFGQYSADAGETWTQPAPTDFISPVSPMALKRIPSTGHLLAIWNDHSGRFPIADPPGRQPLVAALSRDEGRTWENHRMIESDLSRGYHYTAICFPDPEHILLEYCAGPRSPGPQLGTLRVRHLPLKWLYA